MHIASLKKGLAVTAVATFALSLMQAALVLAASETTFSQTITDGTQSVDIVDESGNPVASPGVSFNGVTFSFDSQNATGSLGSASESVRVYNPTGDAVWSVSLAATNGASAVWSNSGGTQTYDFNDAANGGQMSVNPAAGTVTGISGCSAATVNKGTSSAFTEGSVDSITLLSGAAGSTYCRWDLQGVALTQEIPASQPSDTYTIDLTMTII